MQIHVSTPLWRVENIPALIEYLEPEQVTWHPICDYPINFGKDWILPIVCVPPDDWHPGAYKTKYLQEYVEIVDDDYWAFMNDDDLYETGFFNKIRQCTEDVIVVSMMRGNHPVDSTGAPYDCFTLLAAPQNMIVAGVGNQQFVIKGRVFRQMPIHNTGLADGMIGEWLKAHYPIRYEPSWYAYFNRLQPGRWDS